MTDSQVQEFLESWIIGAERVFKFRRELVPTEYVVLIKSLDDKFRCGERSTMDLGELELPDISMLLRRNLLIPMDSLYYQDLKRLKTGGCTCGQWATSEPNLHYRDCDLYRGN